MNRIKEIAELKQGYIDLITGYHAELGIGVTDATVIVDLAFNVVQKTQERIMETTDLLPRSQRDVMLGITLKMLEGLVRDAQEVLYEGAEGLVTDVTSADLIGAFGEDPVEVALRNAGIVVDREHYGVVLYKALDVNCDCEACARMRRIALEETDLRIVPDITIGNKLLDAYILPIARMASLRLEAQGIPIQ